MRINGTNPANPIFLVDTSGNYLMKPDGSYILFDGEAHLDDAGMHLVDDAGNYLVDTNGAYLDAQGLPDPVTAAASVTMVQPIVSLTSDTVAPQTTGSLHVPWLNDDDTDEQTQEEKKEKDKQNLAIIILGATLALVLVVMGILYILKETTPTRDDTTTAPTSSAFTPLPPVTDSPTEEEEEDDEDDDIPTEAFDGAGGAIPSDAHQMKSDGYLSIVKVPSGNITCAFSKSFGECRVESWLTNSPYGSSDGNPNAKISFSSDGSVFVEPVSDALDASSEYTLNYNSVAYAHNWVCGSAENGITCWNSSTGHGAFINRDGYKEF